MNASIEMKAVALEKLIAARKDLLQQQYNLHAYCSALEECSILIYSTKEFMEYAEYFERQVSVGKEPEAYIGTRLSFFYKKTEICAYASDLEMKKYFGEDVVKSHE